MIPEDQRLNILMNQIAEMNRKIIYMEEKLNEHLVRRDYCPHEKKTRLSDY